MVKIAVLLNPAGDPVGVTCRGHAGFGEGGPDLVCAAVSALTGALGIAFSEVIHLPVELSAGHGKFSLLLGPGSVDHPDWPSARTLLRTTWLALQQLACLNQGFLQLRTRRHPVEGATHPQQAFRPSKRQEESDK